MSHFIQAIITKKTDILFGLNFKDLPQGFVILRNTKLNKKSIVNQDFITVNTDYFGGAGEQSCRLYQSGTRKKLKDINEGLKILGVIKKTHDEFDAVELSDFRTNDDIYQKI